MFARALIVCAVLVATGAFVSHASVRVSQAARSSLASLPTEIGAWHGYDMAPLPDDVIATLGVDEYVSRRYERNGRPISLYIGYYANQRSGDTIHSPQNCLPGAGWLPVSSGREQIASDAGASIVTRYEIVKGLDRQMVLYWYQGRGRVVAGEYANKAWLMLDAARYGRSDGGLVRIIGPVVTTREDALTEISSFASAIMPRLSGYLP